MFGETIITRARRALHDVVEALIDIGVHRLRRDEHQRHVLRLARDQVFVGDVGDVLGDVGPDALHRRLALIVGRAVAPRRHRLERKFGVDDEMARLRHEDHAVRPRLVGQRELEFVGALGQEIGDDRLELALAERAARLLVGEDIVERADMRSHLARKLGDVLLRAVYNGEPCMQVLQGLRGGGG